VDQFEMGQAYIELAEEWNSSMVECEEKEEWEDPHIFSIQNETVQEVEVKQEPRTCLFLTIQDGECDHTKWLDTQKMK